MRDRDLYAKLLGIEAPWAVRDVQLVEAEKQVEVYIDHEGPVRCPDCDEETSRYDARERRWRHLDTMQYQTILVAQVPRANCDKHGVRQVRLPWAEPGSRFTALFEALVIDWLQEASILAVQRRVGLSWDEKYRVRRIARLMHRQGPAISKLLARRRQATPPPRAPGDRPTGSAVDPRDRLVATAGRLAAGGERIAEQALELGQINGLW